MSRRRGPGGSERAFQTAVLELAQVTGWRSYHPHDSRRSAAGYPDLTLVRAGACILAELKTDTGRVTDAQAAWLAAFAAVSGIEAVVWRPRDWPVIEARLTRPWPPWGAATRSRFPRSRALHVLAPVEDDRTQEWCA